MFKISIGGIQNWHSERIRTSVSSEESFKTKEEAFIAYQKGEYNCDTSQLDDIDEYTIQNEDGTEVQWL